jgi:hypothetical protein
MVSFAIGLWVGGAVGACIMGMLCSRDDAELDLRDVEAERSASRHVAAVRRADVAIVLH